MDTFAKHINRRHIFKDLPNQMLVPKSDWDNYYNHYTIRVSSLSEFIEVISKLTQKSKDTEYNRLVYRGHSNSSSNYRLIPSLARYDGALERSENIMLMTRMVIFCWRNVRISVICLGDICCFLNEVA